MVSSLFTTGEGLRTLNEEIKNNYDLIYGEIIEKVENGIYKRRFSCCGEDCTKLTQWMIPNYCPNCGAKLGIKGEDKNETN